MSDKKQQFNVYLPPELIRRIKHAAIDSDQSLSYYVEKTLSNRLDQPPAESNPSTTTTSSLLAMPIVYVTAMVASLTFYQALGFTLRHQGKSWSELEMSDTRLGLHLTDGDLPNSGRVALAMVCHEKLESLVERLDAAGVTIEGEIVDEAFGRFVLVRDPDGLPVQINEHDPDLYA